jgi:hypothetical protein
MHISLTPTLEPTNLAGLKVVHHSIPRRVDYQAYARRGPRPSHEPSHDDRKNGVRPEICIGLLGDEDKADRTPPKVGTNPPAADIGAMSNMDMNVPRTPVVFIPAQRPAP